MMMTGEELEHEAAGPAIRDEGADARVLRLDGPPPAFFVFSGLPALATRSDSPQSSSSWLGEPPPRTTPPANLSAGEKTR